MAMGGYAGVALLFIIHIMIAICLGVGYQTRFVPNLAMLASDLLV